MKISYNTLNKFFDGKLPSPEEVGNALTFHSWEIEDIVPMESDTMIDVKVLPDKSSWALSHRGIAKDLSVILDMPLSIDPLKEPAALSPIDPTIAIKLETDTCMRYTAALIRGVKVGPSPAWLVSELKTLGQRSINNIVDITNYVMFSMGQPLHAYDVAKLQDTKITVRNATEGEKITTLTGEEYTLRAQDAVIADGKSDAPIGIAGIKGGKLAEVTKDTADILLEAGNFKHVPVRKTSQYLKLRTDASQRYENGIVPEMTAYGLREAVQLIREIAGGDVVGYADTGLPPRMVAPVSVSVEKINGVLGITVTEPELESILTRFGYTYALAESSITVTPPFERTDVVIPEDVIEEIGRVHGYADIPSIIPEPLPLGEINKRFYYSEIIRDVLTTLGFSEVYTSSFNDKDEVQIANAFASDKGYLRSALRENLEAALKRNVPQKDLLGLTFVGVFEIGTVFKKNGEQFNVALGVRHGADYKEKADDPVLTAAIESLRGALLRFDADIANGIAEFDFGALLPSLPEPTAYAVYEKNENVTYKPFSPFPAVSRDIAFWVHDGTPTGDVERMLKDDAGELCVRISHFDEFSKDGRTSYAFRLVFQSSEKTLTDMEVNAIMDRVYEKVRDRGFQVR
jgi:phenylalanyl-tRNA synthetase beta chain